MPRFLLLASCLVLAACGEEEAPVARANSVDELSNRLDKLSDRTSEDIELPPRLLPLLAPDVGPELRARPACRLGRDGHLLLIVNAAGAVARIDGRRVPLAVSGPVGPTGGFFTAPGITVSVGRVAPFANDAADYAQDWPARVSIGGDKERPIEKYEASWMCVR
ncbi:MAG: hypothetical protein ACJ8ER_03365 [Allosphingosinicella sp.]